jgi:tetratricopeptide (TPR) repeat protein
MNATTNKPFAKRRAWLAGIILFFILLVALAFYFGSRWRSGKVQHQLGMYYYNKATKTHFWGGAPETNMDELGKAAAYFEQANANGYHTKTAYLNMAHYYQGTSNYKQEAAAYTGILKLCPDSSDYYFYRAGCRHSMKDYKGALQDYNEALKPGNHLTYLTDAYYMRGAMKYLLNPKDTTAAETDRKMAAKHNVYGTNLLPYKTYWETNR